MDRRDFLKASSILAISSPFLNLGANDNISTDIHLTPQEFKTLQEVRAKLKAVKKTIGYGNFNIISFDDTLTIGRRYSRVGSFTKEQIAFMERLFYEDPKTHGFYGNKTCQNITDKINKKEVHKIPYTGHYLFKGKTTNTYDHMKKDIGNSIILTSGVRSVVKQFSLFLGKINSTKGNLTLASKSIAPPAYSFHTIGDFDVGKKGYGYANFTPRFALTKEFLQMQKLSYIKMRYTLNNKDGVRFEPWHVEII